METQPGIPEGFVLVPKGGRPKSTSRDIAVYLAYLLKKEELGKVYLAHDFVVEEFALSDASHAKKCQKNAKKALSSKGMVLRLEECMLFFEGNRTVRGMEIVKGAKVWIWRPGLQKALEAKAVDSVFYHDSIFSFPAKMISSIFSCVNRG